MTVQELTRDSFGGIDIALFSAGGAISREFAPLAAQAGCVVVDDSSAFRMDDSVPLVVPEIDGADARGHRGIIANPNCTTAITLMALYPLHRAFGCTRVFASSYQAVSGTGAKAIEELERQVRQIAERPVPSPREVYPHQIAFERPPPGGFLPPRWLHQGGDEAAKRGSQDHAPPGLPREHHLCPGPGVQRAHSVAVSAEFGSPWPTPPGTCSPRHPASIWSIRPAKNKYPLPLYVSG